MATLCIPNASHNSMICTEDPSVAPQDSSAILSLEPSTRAANSTTPCYNFTYQSRLHRTRVELCRSEADIQRAWASFVDRFRINTRPLLPDAVAAPVSPLSVSPSNPTTPPSSNPRPSRSNRMPHPRPPAATPPSATPETIVAEQAPTPPARVPLESLGYCLEFMCGNPDRLPAPPANLGSERSNYWMRRRPNPLDMSDYLRGEHPLENPRNQGVNFGTRENILAPITAQLGNIGVNGIGLDLFALARLLFPSAPPVHLPSYREVEADLDLTRAFTRPFERVAAQAQDIWMEHARPIENERSHAVFEIVFDEYAAVESLRATEYAQVEQADAAALESLRSTLRQNFSGPLPTRIFPGGLEIRMTYETSLSNQSTDNYWFRMERNGSVFFARICLSIEGPVYPQVYRERTGHPFNLSRLRIWGRQS